MSLRLYWFLPTHGDGRSVGRDAGSGDARRPVDLDYLLQVALAAERAGFTGALTPFGLYCEDPWVVAAALCRATERLRFMVAFRPGLGSPVLTAQMAASLQTFSGGRLDLNVVTGGDPVEQRRYGDWLDHDRRYARTDEFLSVMREAWRSPVDFSGEHYHVAGGTVIRAPGVLPTVFVGGSSDAAVEVSARHADVHLCWGEPLPQLSEHLDHVRARVAQHAPERRLAYGTRLHVISRRTAGEAWEEAERLVSGMSVETIRRNQRRMSAGDSEGQRRMTALQDGRTEGVEVSPNMWTGISLIRQGPGITLVGSHEEVADRIAELHEVGVEHLILSGQPHLEEAYTVGEGLVPLLRARGVLHDPSAPTPPADARRPVAGAVS